MADRLRPAKCYGNRTLALTGFAVHTTDLGGTLGYTLAPGWFDATVLAEYGLQATTARIAGDPRYGAGPYLLVVSPRQWATHPLAALDGHWVTVRGHFDDPAAQTCRATAGEAPSVAKIVAMCREAFVLTSVRAASGPPSTDTTVASAPAGTVPRPWLLAAVAAAAFCAVLIRTRRPSCLETKPSRPA